MEELGSDYHVRKAGNVVPLPRPRLHVYKQGRDLLDSIQASVVEIQLVLQGIG